MRNYPVLSARSCNTLARLSAIALFCLILTGAVLFFLHYQIATAREIPLPTKHVVDNAFSGGAAWVQAGDIDRDGDQDLVSAWPDANAFRWTENDGEGVFTPTHTITDTYFMSWPSQLADLDGDSDPDLLAAIFLTDTDDYALVWLDNDGTPADGPWPMHTIQAGLGDVYWVEGADLNRDGHLDVASAAGNQLAWWQNDGSPADGGWTELTVTDTYSSARGGAAVDLDLDGDLDFVSGSEGRQTLDWWQNDGSPADGGWIQHQISDSLPSVYWIQAADLDQDGDPDIVVSSGRYSGRIDWWENDGTPTDGGWTQHPIEDLVEYSNYFRVRDIDFDGDLDLLGGDQFSSWLNWWENLDGQGGNWLRHRPAYSPMTFSADAADLDGDGDADFAAASWADSEIAYWDNQTIHRSAAFSLKETVDPQFDGAWDLYAADINNDGKLDIVGAGTYHNTPTVGWISWWRNNDGVGTNWTEFVVVDQDGFDGAVSIRAADLDADGDLDLMGAAWQDDAVAWWENSGGGASWTRHDLSTSFAGAYCVRAGDIDGDGDLDVAAGGSENNQLAWWENDGTTGSWTIHIIHDIHAHNVRAFELQDMDTDGDLDAILAVIGYDYLIWYENDGSGGNWDSHPISGGWQSFDNAQSVYVADLDRDGDFDVLGTMNNPSNSEDDLGWYENDGSSTGWTWHSIAADFNSADGVRTADLDQDGDLDVLCSNATELKWSENTAGDGSSWSTHVLEADFEGKNLWPADLDGDGDVDVLGPDTGKHDVVWWPNLGGQFALETTNTAPAEIVSGQADDLLRVRVTHRGWASDRDLELVKLELLLEQSAGDPLTTAEANALIGALHVYRDDGSQIFDPVWDTLVTTVYTLDLTAGVQLVTFTNDDPAVQVAQGSPQSYFVVPELAPFAGQQTPNQFRVSHPADTGSGAQDRDYDIPLLIEYTTAVASGVVQSRSEAELSITKTSGLTEAVPGLPLTYTVVVSNAGPSGAADVTVADTLPAQLQDVSWTCVADAGASCAASGSGDIGDSADLPAGTVVTYTVAGTIDPAATGALDNTASLTVPAGVTDPDQNNNEDSDSVPLAPTADLSIGKTSDLTEAVPGLSLTYTIVVSNTGPSDAADVTVADTMPEQLQGVSWTCMASVGANCTASGSDDIGDSADLPARTVVTYTVVGTINPAATGTLDNTASLSMPGGVTDPNLGNNEDTDSVTLVPIADLQLSKHSSAQSVMAGSPINYTIVVSNAGPSHAPGATVSDTVPSEVSGVSWTCQSTGGATCAASGSGDLEETVNLPAGSSLTFTLSGTVSSNQPFTNTATVTVPEGVTDPAAANNSSSAGNVIFQVFLPLLVR